MARLSELPPFATSSPFLNNSFLRDSNQCFMKAWILKFAHFQIPVRFSGKHTSGLFGRRSKRGLPSSLEEVERSKFNLFRWLYHGNCSRQLFVQIFAMWCLFEMLKICSIPLSSKRFQLIREGFKVFYFICRNWFYESMDSQVCPFPKDSCKDLICQLFITQSNS